MEIKVIKNNDGVLAFNRKSATTARVHHFNNDDGHYFYSYDVSGTTKELDVIEEFCAKLSGHHGKKNPYMHMDCKHQYQEVSASQANKDRGSKQRKAHPNIAHYQMSKCSICDKYQDYCLFHGFPVAWGECEFNSKTDKFHYISIWVHPVKFKNVPTHIGDDAVRHYYVDPKIEKKLISLGFKKDSSCGYVNEDLKRIFFKLRYPNPLKKVSR